jgi:23S rRNA pseudouridine1911/1915/1917 synthase
MEPFNLERLESVFFSKRHQFSYHDAPPKTLLDALKRELSHIPEDSWLERLNWGGVMINGKEVSADTDLPTPCKIDYYEPNFPISEAHKLFPQFDRSWILFEDEFLIVVYKPAGLPSLPAIEQKYFNIRTYLEKYSASQIHMPSRLDMSTQGIIVVSKAAAMHKQLQSLFEQRKIVKEYRLHTSSQVSWTSLDLQARIGHSALHPVLREVVKNSGKKALTGFSLLLKKPDGALIQAFPLTGRTHQIRVHAAFAGIPITGDNFYGGKENKGLRLASFGLSFVHPVTKSALSFAIPQPLKPDWLF